MPLSDRCGPADDSALPVVVWQGHPMIPTPVTHALTMNGRIHGELKDPDEVPEVVLRKRLELLDGIDRYSLSLWRLPEGVPFDRVDLAEWPQEYVQVAGSRERLTAEVRRIENTASRHYVIGRDSAALDPGPLVEEDVPWNGYGVTVLANEILNAAEAAQVFIAYLTDVCPPEGFTLRPLNL